MIDDKLLDYLNSLPDEQLKARNKMKAVINLWKGGRTSEDICEYNNITLKELEFWSLTALHGAVDALRNKCKK